MREQFFQRIELGWSHDQLVEFIGGEVIDMEAQLDLHLASVTLAEDSLRAAFGSGNWVRANGSWI